MTKSTIRKTARGKPPSGASLLRIHYPASQGNGFVRYDFDLGEREYAAIGYAIVHWAFLEEAIFKRTVLFARRAKVRTPREAHDLSFAQRIRALRILMNAVVKDPKRRKWWNALISRVGKENGLRQKIVHGLWSYNARHPERLFSSPRPSLGRWMTQLSAETLSGFGERVGGLSFALLHPSPAGRPSKNFDIPPAYMNRQFLLALTGKAGGLGFSPTIPTTLSPQLTPSQERFLRGLMPKGR
jgi:hypothetical protein